jgi:hypothetical protein
MIMKRNYRVIRPRVSIADERRAIGAFHKRRLAARRREQRREWLITAGYFTFVVVVLGLAVAGYLT